MAAGAAAPATTAGAMLRRMREAAGVDPVLLASAMKVSPQKLDALENDRLDLLPDTTFARGLASAICRAFGADPAPVLERMPVSAPGLRPPTQNINQPFRRTGDRPTPMLGNPFSRPLLIGVAALSGCEVRGRTTAGCANRCARARISRPPDCGARRARRRRPYADRFGTTRLPIMVCLPPTRSGVT